MKYCKICITPTTYPGVILNKSNICLTCIASIKHYEEHNEYIKKIILNEIFTKHKSNESHYDCILGVSGGADSTKLALWLKEKFNVKPLLVCCTYPPEQITETGALNLSNLINKGFDVIVSAPAPFTWKQILKKGFYEGNYNRGPETALYSSLPQIAIKYKIKLIFWGEGGGTSKVYDKKIISKENKYDANNIRYSNTLKNCDLKWLGYHFKKNKLIPYIYPSIKEFKKNKLQIIYLGNFWKKHTYDDTGIFSLTNGMNLSKYRKEEIGDISKIKALDDTFVSINQMIKFLKFGVGRVTDHLNYEIRNKTITRKVAVNIASKYDGKCSQFFIDEFCKYIDIKEKVFWKTIKKFVNKKLFSVANKGKRLIFKPKFKVGYGINY